MTETTFQPLDADLPGQEPARDQLYITDEICDHWRQTSRWTLNSAITGFLFIGLMLMGLYYVARIAFNLPTELFMVVGIICSVVFVIARNLYRYAVNIRKAADNSEWEAMDRAFDSLKNAYAVYTIAAACAALVVLCAIGFYAYTLYPVISQSF